MNQAALTVVVPIVGSELSSLHTLLASIEDQVRERKIRALQGALFPFADVGTIHFARFVVIDPPAERPDASRLLVFSTNHDGSRARHLHDLVAVAGTALRRVFAHCDKQVEGADDARLRAFLDEHSLACDAFYVGHRRRSVSQIQLESYLHAELDRALGPASGRLSSDPYAEALRCVSERDDLRWALSPPDPPRQSWLRKAPRLAALGVGALVLLPVLAVWALCIRVLERREARKARRYSREELLEAHDKLHEHKRTLIEAEDISVQNQMSAVTDVKPGWLRLVTLRAVLRLVDFLARNWWDRGALNGIPSIHFARWFLIEQGGRHRLVFFSNYDGSWENYLGQFIDEAASGLTGIWSNTLGFPAARWLFFRGARREREFKTWVRSRQIRTQVWYSAYPDLSVQDVWNNSAIRRDLQGMRGLGRKREWLRRV